ncbi:PspC domain-containing protein [Nocardioides sp. Bht2]|uniref:PspC domain-containing protein n=1 Tax=Nocardioides sp. Bht2 TaxID=3392297 RepID=UPI0039B5A775
MNETTPGGGPEAPHQPAGPGPHEGSHYDGGPRVTGEEIRDLGRLRRTVDDKYVAGVAGGLARHLDIDPVILRVAFVVLTFFGGAGLIVYGACWLLVPEEGRNDAPIDLDVRSRSIALMVIGAVAGLAMVGDLFGEGPGGWIAWPLVVVGAIAWMILWHRDRRRAGRTAVHHGFMPPGGYGHGPGPVGPGPAASGFGPGPAGPAYGPGSAPGAVPPQAPPGTPYRSPQEWARDYAESQKQAALASAYAGYQQQVPPQPPPAPVYRVRDPRKRGPILFWFTLALMALSLGTLGIIDGAGASVAGSAYPALALGVVAVMLLVGAFFGRAGGLIPIGLIVALCLGGATVADRFDGDQIRHAPTSASAVQDRYEMGIGEMVVDLTQVEDLDGLDGRSIRFEGDLGSIKVIVPDGLDLGVDARVSGGGEVRALGQQQSGWGVSLSANQDRGAVAPRIQINADLDFGEIEVVTR